MRGMLMWMLMMLVIVGLILLAAFASFFVGSRETATGLLASVQAAHIAGIINTMQVSPDDAQHVYEMPKAECNLIITPNSVYIELPKSDQKHSVSLILSDTKVNTFSMVCSEDEIRAIKFEKKENRIEMTQLPVTENG